MANTTKAEQVFSDLGFNQLESEVYVSLLRNGPQTAYRISKLVNRPTANVYKAVHALQKAGAVEVDSSDVNICRAIPIASVVKQFESNYARSLEKAVDVLGNIQAAEKNEGIFAMQSVEAVLQRAREMLKRAKAIVVADLFPAPMKLLLNDLEKKAAKKCEVYLQAYEPVQIKGVSVAIPKVAAESISYWKAQQLNLAVDGNEMLVALFNEDMSELIQATYSNNLYLSCLVYNGLISEHRVHLYSAAGTMKELETLKEQQKFFINSHVPGLNQLFKLYKHIS